MSAPRITLLTDFGTRDGYVGAMKASIVRNCPHAIIDDISHDIEQGDMVGAAYALTYYFSVYPVGTIHVVVVDPGVGTERRALAVREDGRIGFGPDNGILRQVVSHNAEIRQLPVPDWSSTTFHGRDVFAPAAGRLANGLDFDQIGERVTGLVELELPPFTRERGEIVYIDHFGNLITNVSEAPRAVQFGQLTLELKRTYGDVAVGEPLALMNSHGVLEIAVRNKSAAEVLRVSRGAAVKLIY